MRRRTVEARFWAKVRKGKGCWQWLGCISSATGYGSFRYGSHNPGYAHRFAYELLVGPIPDGLSIDHLCRHPWCVKPAHMEACSIRTNILRSDNPCAINARKTHCSRGHPLAGSNLLRNTQRPHERRCRTCDNARQRQKYQRLKTTKGPLDLSATTP